MIIALVLISALLAFGFWMSSNAKTGPQDTMGNGLIFIGAVMLLIVLLVALR